MSNNLTQILIIEDNLGDVRLIREYLRLSAFGEFELTHAQSLKAGLDCLLQQRADVILLDLGLPDTQGLETFSRVNSQAQGTPIIVLTGLDDIEMSLAAVKIGAQDYLPKNEVTSDLLGRAIRYAIERKNVETKLAGRNREIEMIYEASQRLSRTLSVKELYQTLYNFVTSVMECDSLFISNYDPVTRLICCSFAMTRAGVIDVSAYPSIPLEPEGSGTQSQVIRTAKALLLNDYHARMQTSQVQLYVEEDGSLRDRSGLEEREDYPRSALILPIILESRVAGVIQIFSIKLNAYSENDLKIAEALAAQFAVASSNAMLYQKAQTEILERKLAEDSLRESEEKWRMLVSNTPDFIALLDAELNFLFMNRFSEGFKPQDVIGSPVYQYISPESVELFKNKYIESLEKWSPVHFEYKAMGDRGEMRFYHNSLIPLHNKNGEINILSVARDITERKKAEDQLRESEVRFRALIENAPGAITLLGGDGRTKFVSSSTQRIMGYMPDEMLGQDPSNYTHPDDLPALLELLRDLMNNPGQVSTTQYRFKHKDGSWRWVESTISNLLYEPAIQAVAFNFQDISERKRAQKLLHLQSAALESAANAIVITDRNGSIEWINPAWSAMTGYSFSEALGKNPRLLKSGLQDQLFYKDMWDTILAGQVWQGELVNRRKDGSFYTESEIITPVWNELGEITHFTAIKQDITARKHAEEEISHHLSELEVLYENSLSINRLLEPKQIAEKLIDILALKLHWHHAAIRLYYRESDKVELVALNNPGFSAKQLAEQIGQINQLITHSAHGFSGWVIKNGIPVRSGDVKSDPRYFQTYPDICSGLYMPIRVGDNILGSISVESEERDAFSEQDERLLQTIASQAAVSIENAQLYLVAQQELGERKRAELELLKAQSELEKRVAARTADLKIANHALEKAAKMKDEFLASMSHELRTPLTGILGLSESLQYKTYGELTEKQNNIVKMIESSGRHLLELINDILDLSKIEAGKLEMQFEPCSLSGICQASLQMIKGLAAQKHLEVRFSITPDSIILRTDGRRLKQMLVNLLSNAVKFTAEGGKLGLEVTGSELESRVRITVWDNGIGIKSEDFPRLFKPFIQLDSSLARQYAGTGLGLSLVQRMASLQGGSIELESTFGEGSRFTIVLPWDLTASKPESPLSLPESISDARVRIPSPMVIIVDDNEVIAAAFSAYLEGQNCRVLPVFSAFELLEKAPQANPDIILMDIQMPGMDGFEAIRRVRSHPSPHLASIPIIAITALAMPGDREKCFDAGANEYLSKPIHLPDLLARIRDMTGIDV
jgi:PAS domain S-box-containing protein